VWLETRISRLSNLPNESTGRSFWPTSTPNHSGMLERLQPAEPRIVAPHSRTPSPPPKINFTLLQHFFPPRPSPPPPLILPAFKDVPLVLPAEVSSHCENAPTRQPLAQVVFLTLTGSRSIRPTSGSFYLCSLPPSPMGTTPCYEQGHRHCLG